MSRLAQGPSGEGFQRPRTQMQRPDPMAAKLRLKAAFDGTIDEAELEAAIRNGGAARLPPELLVSARVRRCLQLLIKFIRRQCTQSLSRRSVYRRSGGCAR